MAIKLYDLAGAEDDRRFSPYCWRVKMALKHKGLDFETIAWRFTEKEALAPYKSTTVPVLVDGSNSVYDSWAIALYLDEVYPSRPRLFEGTESRALCDFLAQWTFKTLHPLVMKIIILELEHQLIQRPSLILVGSLALRRAWPRRTPDFGTASWKSCSHGAGRRMSRSQARKSLTVQSLTDAMGTRTWNDTRAEDLIDEHPDAYKDIDTVMANQADLVAIEHTLSQIFNYKG